MKKWLPLLSMFRTERRKEVVSFGGYYSQIRPENVLNKPCLPKQIYNF